MKFDHPAIPFAGRLGLMYVFVTSGWSKATDWAGNISYMETRHVPFIPFFLALATLIEIGGSLSLVTGYKVRPVAFLMAGYLLIVTLLYHNYWAYPALQAGMVETHFRKNLAIIGGLLMLAYAGPGRWALDRSARGTDA